MRLLRSSVVLVSLCVVLAASAAATEGPSRPVRQEAGLVTRFVQDLQSFLKAVWDNEGYEIDPLGRNSQDPATPGTDEGYEIDPWG